MFGRTVSGFGSRAKRGAPPLSISVAYNAGEGIIEAAAPAGLTIDTNAGDVDATGSASGGSAPYSFAWTVTEDSDQGNCAVLAAGTQNVAQYNTLTLRTVIPANAFDPPVEANYTLRCTVTDSTSATASATLNLLVVSIPL